MKYWITLIALCISVIVFAQERPTSDKSTAGSPAIGLPEAGKGVAPVANLQSVIRNPQSTRAVVIGISDYQDPNIPDLRFADKDAEAFANFLRSPAGGSLDEDHLKLLTNSAATLGQFAATLDWLLEVSKEGDLVILYFSGHGDVEKKTITQPGYLLCWDAPSHIYLGGGALALPMFQDVVTTLSAQNKAKVVVITDACRAGKLAGSSVGGTQITGANLARQYANEIKILSCQPDEYSIEGEQWGGGRGAFSYNLVDALYGMADANNDLSVTLKEVGRYLEDRVSAEVAPVPQNPKVIGNPAEQLATVDANLLADLRSGRINQQLLLSPVETRGIEDDVLAGVDSNMRELYRLFEKALEEKVLLIPNAGDPASACAEAYFQRLMAEPKIARLHSTITRNYAAALQDDAQQTLNRWLQTNQDVALAADNNTQRLPIKVFTEKVRSYPRCLERAAELLGKGHYMYAALKARQYFFEGYLLANSDRNPNKELGKRALALFRQSLDWQPEQPHIYWQIGKVYGYNFLQPDSAEYYTQRAIQLYPAWLSPYTSIVFLFSQKFKLFDRAKPYLEQALQLDSNSTDVLLKWGLYLNYQREFDEAEKIFKKAIQLDPEYSTLYNNLGKNYNEAGRYAEAEQVLKKALQLDSTYVQAYFNLGRNYLRTRRYAEAEQQFKKAIEVDSNYVYTYEDLAIVYDKTRRYTEAEQQLKKAIQLDSTAWSFNRLGLIYFNSDQFAEAEQQFKIASQLDSTYTMPIYNLACLASYQHKVEEAYEWLEQALDKGYSDYDFMQTDTDLPPLRAQTERWEALMKKYFPEQYKN